MNNAKRKEFENKVAELYRELSGNHTSVRVVGAREKKHDCCSVVVVGHKNNIRQKRKIARNVIALLLPPGQACRRCKGTGIEPIVPI